MNDEEIEKTLARLPPRAAEAFRALADRRFEAWSAVDGLSRKFRELIEERNSLRTRHSAPIAFRERKGDTAGAAELRAEIAAAEKRLATVGDQRDRATERHSEIGSLVRNIVDHVLELPPGRGFRDVVIEPPVIPNNDLHGALEGRRRRLRELLADAHRVRSAPRPSAAAKALVRAEVERLAEKGQPDVSGSIEVVGADEIASVIEWPRNPSTAAFDLHALLAWVCRDQLVAALDREVDQLADDAAALSDADRAEKLAEIAADMLACEMQEELVARMIEATGSSVRRRPDADPRAVLAVAEVDVKAIEVPEKAPKIIGWEPAPRYTPDMGLSSIDRSRIAPAAAAAAAGGDGGSGMMEAAAAIGMRPGPSLAGADHVAAHGPAVGLGDEPSELPEVARDFDDAGRHGRKGRKSGRA